MPQRRMGQVPPSHDDRHGLCEAAVLFGFSLTFLAQMFILILPFAGAGLVMMVWQFPTEAGVFAVARTMREANSE